MKNAMLRKAVVCLALVLKATQRMTTQTFSRRILVACAAATILAGCSMKVTPQLPAGGEYSAPTQMAVPNSGDCPPKLAISPALTFTHESVHVTLKDALEVRKPGVSSMGNSGGNLKVSKNREEAIFFSRVLGTYTVRATYKHYRAKAVVLVQRNNERLTASVGGHPNGGLLLAADGTLFGVTYSGGSGSCHCGSVFEVVPGSTNAIVIHSFQDGQNDGAYPSGALISDADGNLFGTTALGGDANGTVYELQRSGAGYGFDIVYRFQGGSNGSGPSTGVIADRSGSLYGTTVDGLVFKLARHGSLYAYDIIHRFNPEYAVGIGLSGLVMDADGALYGTNSGAPGAHGGSCVCGIVYELRPNGSSYRERTLHSFKTNYNY